MAKKIEIQQLYEEAIKLGKYSKSKVAKQFWKLIGRIEKILETSPDLLEQEKIKELNVLKKKF